MLLTTILGCASTLNRTAWIRLGAGDVFSFYAPADTRQLPVGGTDPYTGSFANSQMRIDFDYGQWTAGFYPQERVQETRVSGMKAQIAVGEIGKGDFPYSAHLRVGTPCRSVKAEGRTKTRCDVLGIVIFCRTPADREDATRVLRSVSIHRR